MSENKSFTHRWLNIFRLAWVVVTVCTIGLIALNFFKIYTPSNLICTPTEDCFLPNKFSSGELSILSNQGKALLNLLLVLEAITWMTYIGVGLLIFWRKSDELIGLVSSLFLITFLSSIISGYVAANHGQFTFLIQTVVISVGQSSLLLLVYIFPDGRFVPHWARWCGFLVGLLFVYIFLGSNFSTSTDQLFGALFGIFYFGLFGLGVLLQIYRYVRVSTPIQRLQTKWVVIAIAMVPLSDLVLRSSVLPKIFPAMMAPGMNHIFWNAITIPLFRNVPFLMVPVAFAFSILKYRLWDIDVLVRKTLVYSILTGLLGFVYFSGVALLQGVLTASQGAQSPASNPSVPASPGPLVIVATTIAVYILFNPLRRRLQETIDRRFYRQKYDAEKALASFAETTRSESELGKVTTCLVDTIQSTLQPEKTLVWISKSTRIEVNNRGGTAL